MLSCFLLLTRQPVPKHGEQSDDNAPIEVKTLADVDPNGGRLPQGYEWCSVDLTDEKEREEVYQLLMNNYVEDDDAMFRFAYNKDFLLWALTVRFFSVSYVSFMSPSNLLFTLQRNSHPFPFPPRSLSVFHASTLSAPWL